MKYGLLLFKDTDNIGDDIQSYAASRFLPKIDYIIDRENIELFVPQEKEYVFTIMNAWYVHDCFNFNFSPFIYPKLLSMHFGFKKYKAGYTIGYDYITDSVKQYLSKYGPVGARDFSTLEMLKEKKIDGYFSGCLTLTIPKFNNIKTKSYICAVNLSKEEIDYIKKNTKRKIIEINQDVEKGSFSNESWEERKNRVEELLKIYQGASFVVTTKLHCALPCLALETPVVLLYDKTHEDRFSSYLPLLNHISREIFYLKKINFEKPKKNPEGYKKYQKKLKKDCQDFIIKSNTIDNANDLPDIIEYKKNTLTERKRRETIIQFLDSLSLKYEQECKKSEKLYYSSLKIKNDVDVVLEIFKEKTGEDENE